MLLDHSEQVAAVNQLHGLAFSEFVAGWSKFGGGNENSFVCSLMIHCPEQVPDGIDLNGVGPAFCLDEPQLTRIGNLGYRANQALVAWT